MRTYGWKNFVADALFAMIVCAVILVFFSENGFISVNDIQAYPY